MSARTSLPLTVILLLAPAFTGAATLEVGTDKPFARIEEANAKAQPGDVILVYRRADGQPYEKTAIYVRQKNLTFRGVPGAGNRWVSISGEGFDYSGRGSTPRAVFQFNPGTDGCLLEGFELSGAHNNSHNGAGVRINQANHVTVRNCSIHHNDMGIMSGGDGTSSAAVDQRIEHCEIHHNGDPADPGYNHNLYLGGTSVTLSFCDIHNSLTGHNVKSRAHHTRVEYCYVHHSANREFDLVDADDTTRPESHAVLLGNVIVKNPRSQGNRTVIHFGQDGGKDHHGTIYLVFNTIVTPFIAPVVELSAPGAKAYLIGNLVSDGGTKQANQKASTVRAGAKPENVGGEYNWFTGGFAPPPGTNLDPQINVFRRAAMPLFVAPDRHDYRLTAAAGKAAAGPRSLGKLALPAVPGEAEPAWQYRHPASKQLRPKEDRPMPGAYADHVD